MSSNFQVHKLEPTATITHIQEKEIKISKILSSNYDIRGYMASAYATDHHLVWVCQSQKQIQKDEQENG